MIKTFTADNTYLNKFFGIKGPATQTYSFETEQEIEPWNAGKTGLQVSEKKGLHRPDLTKESLIKLAKAAKLFHTGRKRSEATKKKMSLAKIGKARPDMIGNKWGAWDRNA